MKLFQLNFIGILFLLLTIALVVVVPSYIVQTVWNSFYASHMDRNMTIEIWQAALLWGAIATLLYMTGIFQFKINFKNLESIDVDAINDPELRAEIEKLKQEAALEEQKQEDKNHPSDFEI